MAAIFYRLFAYAGLERWIDSLASAPVEQPPGILIAVYRYFLQPMRGLFVTTLLVSLVASVIELSLFGFLGTLVDRMATASPDCFLSENLWLLVLMGIVVLVLRAGTLFRRTKLPPTVWSLAISHVSQSELAAPAPRRDRMGVLGLDINCIRTYSMLDNSG